jgi:hypothetical protein
MIDSVILGIDTDVERGLLFIQAYFIVIRLHGAPRLALHDFSYEAQWIGVFYVVFFLGSFRGEL